MPEQSGQPISEQTIISLKISSWWHVIALLVVMVACYMGLKGDTDAALTMSKATAAEQKITQEKVNSMQSDIRSVAQDVNWFRQQYERDMNNFIREQPPREPEKLKGR